MPLGGFPFHSDPALGWDTAGNAYSATLGIKGGTIKVIVSKSTDRGLTWSRPVEVPSGSSNDKELLWVDNRRESPCRDFVYLADVRDAETVMKRLPEWFEEYNERHPHKGLKMLTPREFRRANSH